ncbi:MAG TPA: GNAT family N-acetyltransferase, partial [Anaerolineae bacterium]|nr:GNAT family N-acetyltransferase [Anaerolineae bacterium]
MSGKYTIRPATIADLPQIAKVARTTWDNTYNYTIAPENRREFLERAYTPENLTPSINAQDHWFYVADLDQTIVGFSHFLRRYHPSQNRAELVRLYVLPEHQNQRIGSLMLANGFDALARARIEHCSVSVQSSNHRA